MSALDEIVAYVERHYVPDDLTPELREQIRAEVEELLADFESAIRIDQSRKDAAAARLSGRTKGRRW